MHKLFASLALLTAFAVGGCADGGVGFEQGFRARIGTDAGRDPGLYMNAGPRAGRYPASGPAVVGPSPGSTVGPGKPLLSGPQYGNPYAAPGYPVPLQPPAIAPIPSGGKVRCMGLNPTNGQPIIPPPGHPGTGWCNNHGGTAAVAEASASATASASAAARAGAPVPKPKPMRPKAKQPQPGCKVYGLPSGGQAKGECKVIIGETVAEHQSPLDLKPPSTPSPPAKKSSEKDDETWLEGLKKRLKYM